MKNNKFLTLLLTLLVCLSMVVSASATTESDFVFALESPDSSVEALDAAVVGSGKTFTVSVNLDKNPGLKAAIAYVEFDTTKLEFVSAEAVVDGVRVPASTVAGRLSVVFGDTNAFFTPNNFATFTATGTVAKLTFKVLEESDLQTSIALKVDERYVMNANGKYDSTVSGDVLNVNVVSAEHVCNENKTVEANNAVEATCTEAGKATDLLCAHCGKLLKEGAAIAALEHDWDEGVITKEPTCAEMGVRTHTCGICGETKLDEHVPATGAHTYGEWKVKTEATTEAEGVEARTCSGCGAEETRSIAKLPVEPAPKNNTLLIVIIVVVVLAGAGVAAYFVLKNKKK